ncbi:MAG: hypothetical protein LKJ88_03100 [Bacilli bacterium]|jgi:putative aldouronate transport system substrate-binding protein|nr:hypothetical protein [Bacilli bacterium]
MKKKVLSLFGLVVLLSALQGCGGSVNTSSGTGIADNFLPNGTSENPYQIVKDPITITIFAPHSAGNPEYADLTMFKYLSKITNIKFNFITPDTSAYTSQRAAIWNSGTNVPDFFLFNNSVSELVQFMENGYNAYAPFNDSSFTYTADGQTINAGNLIDNYMPYYKAGLEKNFGIDITKSDAKKVATLSDGKMYCTVSVSDVPRDLTYKMFINKQWIDSLNERYDLGLPEPDDIKTVEQYLTVLRAFKQYDANNNGDPDDEIPVSSKSLEYLRNFIMASYGYANQSTEINAEKTNYEYTPYTTAYRKYLETMNTMYKEGLLHNNTFSITTDAQLAKYGNKDQLGSFVSAAAYITVGYDYESQYVTFGPLTSDYYKGTPIHWGFGNFKPDGACIPTRSKYIREVARLIDIMYSPLGTQLISYGVEGSDWTWDDEAHTSWTFHVPENWTGNQEQYRATITPNVNSASALYWSYDFVGKMNDTIIKALNQMSERYVPYLKNPEPWELKLSSAEYNTVTTVKAALDPQLEYLEASYVRGDSGADPYDDTSWNSFTDKLKRYGADSLVKCYNDALSRSKAA